MAAITLYVKPGCAVNARQRRLLESAGHRVQTRDLLAEPWTAERLLAFFAEMPVAQWFNRAAPRIKSGEIDPLCVSPESAIALMLEDRLLIRRPLIEVGETRIAGFDLQRLRTDIALELSGADELQDGSRRAAGHAAQSWDQCVRTAAATVLPERAASLAGQIRGVHEN